MLIRKTSVNKWGIYFDKYIKYIRINKNAKYETEKWPTIAKIKVHKDQ